MQPKEFKYILTDAEARSLFVENDSVKKSILPRSLEYTPDGWQETLVKYGRNLKYFGVFRSFTVPLKFVKDGARIMRDAYYKKFIEAQVWLNISRLNHDTYGHELFYKGEIDFSNYTDAETYFEANVMEGGLSKLITANEGTTYEIPIDVPEAVNVSMDGISINYKLIYQILALRNLTNVLGVQYLRREGMETGIIGGSQQSGFSDLTINNIGTGTQSVTNARVKGSVTVTPIGGTRTHQLILQKIDKNNVFTSRSLTTATSISAKTTFTFDLLLSSVNMTVGEGDRLAIIDNGVNIFQYEESSMEVTFTARYKKTLAKALPAYYIYQKLISNMSGGANTGISNLLQSLPGLVITCGDAVRGLSGAKIKTTYNDFFQWVNSILNVAFSIENQAGVLEAKMDMLNPDLVIADLGEVTDLFVNNFGELVKRIKVGYTNQDVEDVNGRNDPNTTHEYTTPFTRVSKELNLVSPYRYDPYGIESIRMNLEGKTTTDSSSDNDVIVLSVNRDVMVDGAATLDRRPNAFASGLPEIATLFNLVYTPKAMLLNHGSYIRAIMQSEDTKFIDFQTSDKTALLQVNYPGGPTVDEDGNVLISQFGNRLFRPYEFKFTTKVSINLASLMEVSPRGVFRFSFNGEVFEGFPMDAGIKPANNDTQEFTLLASPYTDPLKLIR